MQTLELYNGNKHLAIPFPESWDELTSPELELIAKEQTIERDHPAENKAALLLQLIALRAKAAKQKLFFNWMKRISKEDAATQGFKAIDFLYTGNERTVNPYPILKTGFLKYYGPEDNFDCITAGELEDSEIEFGNFQEETESDYLAHIVSILWRRKKYFLFGQKLSYSKKRTEKNFKRFRKLSPEKLLAIYIWYAGCRLQLPKLFPHVYAGGGSGARDIMAFTKCIHAGAGPKNGTRDNIRKMLAKEFLFDMEQEAKHAAELEKKQQEQLRKNKR